MKREERSDGKEALSLTTGMMGVFVAAFTNRQRLLHTGGRQLLHKLTPLLGWVTDQDLSHLVANAVHLLGGNVFHAREHNMTGKSVYLCHPIQNLLDERTRLISKVKLNVRPNDKLGLDRERSTAPVTWGRVIDHFQRGHAIL